MILKKLYESYDLSIDHILIKEFKRLDLSIQEMSILLVLFLMHKKRKTFSIASIARRVDYSKNEIGTYVESLMDKGFIKIFLEDKDGKEREIFEIDPTFDKIEELIRQDNLDKIKQIYESSISETITLLEQGLGRALMPYELENVRRWYEEKKYHHIKIINAIESAKDKVSIKYVERILSQIALEKIEIDDDVDTALDEIFKGIK